MPTRVEALALRCILPGFEGAEPPEWVLRRVAEGLGGVVLYGRNVVEAEQVASLNARLHSERPELLIAIDEEGGDVTRLEAKTGHSTPGNLALGAARDTELTRRVAASIGAELAAVGVDLDFAPDADVNTNPANPIIGVRSFGSDPSLVAAHAAAWVEGLQSAGVAACAKHFPGHGDTSVDSHVALPGVNEDPHLRALRPFEAAIRAGVRCVMSAHIVVRPLDSAPGTVSLAIMTRLLRDELGFEGLAITDGLEMRGLSDGVHVAGVAVEALRAGCDALCVGGGLTAAEVVDDMVAEIAGAVAAGRLSEERLVEAASRVDALAEWKLAGRGRPRPDRDAGRVAARRALAHEGDASVGAEALVVRLDTPHSIASGILPWGVADALASRGVRVERLDVEGSLDPADVDSRVNGRTLVLNVRNLNRQPDRLQGLETLLSRHPDAVVVEMGYPACRPKGGRAYIATYGASRVLAEAAAELMRP